MDESRPHPQLEMIWPAQRLDAPPSIHLPAGYALRTHRAEDTPRFYQVMALAGWPGWDDARLRPWLGRILPQGWFVIVCQERGQIVATAMALTSEAYPGGGELGWLASDPDHRGRGLGLVAAAAVTAWFIEAGRRPMHLYTEDYRLPALKTYLKLGYVPFLCQPEMGDRWRTVCQQLGWPFTPDGWPSRA